MNSVTVDELVMRIEVELDKFRAQAGEAENIDKRLRKSLKDTEKSAKDTGVGFTKLGEDVQASNKALTSKLKTLATVTTRLVGFFGVLAGSNAVNRFATGIAKANDNLNFMAQRLGMSAQNLKGLDTAVAALGGSGAGAMATIASLNQGIQEMVLMGNDTLIPFFGALGVGVTDAQGNIRNMDAILLDMADSFSKMDPQKAYAMASAMGLDEGVANALIQGREAMQEMIDLQASMYVSTQAELRASRELNKAQALLGARWEGLKTIIGNAVIPVLLKMTNVVSGWLDYLNRNDRTVKNFFEGMSIAIGVVLIPMLLKGAVAMLAFMSPFLVTTLAVGALAAAFGLLYDDYKTWAEGGKSLFDWGGFDKAIERVKGKVADLREGLKELINYVKESVLPIFRDLGNLHQELKEGNYENAGKTFGQIVNKVDKVIDDAVLGSLEWALRQAGYTEQADEVAARRKKREGESDANIERLEGEKIPRAPVPGMAALGEMLGEGGGNTGSFTAGAIEGFTEEESAAYATKLAQRESAGRVDAVNSYGYTGLYQFGASALAETGFIDKEKLKEAGAGVKSGANAEKHKAFLENPENWLIGDYETYKSSREMQDESLKRLTEANLRYTKGAHGGDKSKMFGAAMAAHLKGQGAANSWYKSEKDSKDGYGTKTSSYAKMGEETYAAYLTKSNKPEPNTEFRNSSIAYGSIEGAQAARAMAAGSLPAASNSQQAGRTLEVNVGQVTVQTSANTLPAATTEGVKAGLRQGLGLAEQLAGGLL